MLIQWVGSPDLRIAHLFGFDVLHTAPKTTKESGHLALFEKPPFFLKALRAAFGAWHIVAASGGTKRVDAESTATLRLSVRCALQAFFTVVSDDFETITCFSVRTCVYGLGIAPPRYQIHRTDPASVSAGGVCEL